MLTVADSSETDRSRDDIASRYTSDGVPIYDPSVASIETFDGQHDLTVPTIRAVPESPKRLPIAVNPPTSPAASKLSPRRVRFEDFPLPPSSRPSLETIALPSDARVQTIRSAALSSLLPIAASQGIARPVTVAQVTRPRARPRQPSPEPLSVTRLYTNGQICRHRLKQTTGATRKKENDAFAKALTTIDPVDGAVEVSEMKDVCWRCAARDEIHCLAGLLYHCICGEKQSKNAHLDGESEPGPAWNNV